MSTALNVQLINLITIGCNQLSQNDFKNESVKVINSTAKTVQKFSRVIPVGNWETPSSKVYYDKECNIIYQEFFTYNDKKQIISKSQTNSKGVIQFSEYYKEGTNFVIKRITNNPTTGIAEIIEENTYNFLGRMTKKTLKNLITSKIQVINYKYSLKGKLKNSKVREIE